MRRERVVGGRRWDAGLEGMRRERVVGEGKRGWDK
jgi:hypothetical protein